MPGFIDHPITLIPQSDAVSCWSAAASMLHGDRTVTTSQARLHKAGGLRNEPSNIAGFAQENGFTMITQCSLSPGALSDLLGRGPIMLCGQVPGGHCYVVGGMNGAQIHIYDPWPPGVGKVMWYSYSALMAQFPLGAMHILQKP